MQNRYSVDFSKANKWENYCCTCVRDDWYICMDHSNHRTTKINACIGAYQGYHGTAWFQKTESNESTKENEFYLKDTEGNVIMSGGIRKAEAKNVEQSDGEVPVVEITFTDEGANKFTKITEEHIGDQVKIYINENKIAAPYVHVAITDGVCVRFQ